MKFIVNILHLTKIGAFTNKINLEIRQWGKGKAIKMGIPGSSVVKSWPANE